MSYFDKSALWNTMRQAKAIIWMPAAFSVLALGACNSIPQNEGAPASVSDVVVRIKQDVARYQAYDKANSLALENLASSCKPSVGFYIVSVKVSLTTQTDDTASATGSATLPVGPVTIGPSVGDSHETKGTQTLTFSLYPQSNPKTSPTDGKPISAEDFPIAATLQRLRDGLLDASQKDPNSCMNLTPPTGSKDDGSGTYAFGFTVINQGTGGLSLKFLVFSLGATASAQRQASNTITVTFKARPGSMAYSQ